MRAGEKSAGAATWAPRKPIYISWALIKQPAFPRPQLQPSDILPPPDWNIHQLLAVVVRDIMSNIYRRAIPRGSTPRCSTMTKKDHVLPRLHTGYVQYSATQRQRPNPDLPTALPPDSST
jgi:hypothetical protein